MLPTKEFIVWTVFFPDHPVLRNQYPIAGNS